MKRILLSEKIKKAPPFLSIEPYLRSQDMPVASHHEAREPRLVPLVVIDYGNPAARIKHMRHVGRLLFGAVGEMWKSARSIRENPYSGKKTIDPQTLGELETYAKSLGIAEIGYTVVNPRYIFRGFRILFPNALVFTIEMNHEKIRQAPSLPSYIEIWRTYYEVGVIVNKVADFLRQHGFNAHAGPAVGGDVNTYRSQSMPDWACLARMDCSSPATAGRVCAWRQSIRTSKTCPLLRKTRMPGCGITAKPATSASRNAQRMRFTRLRKPWPMVGRLSLTTPNAPCRFPMTTAALCA